MMIKFYLIQFTDLHLKNKKADARTTHLKYQRNIKIQLKYAFKLRF